MNIRYPQNLLQMPLLWAFLFSLTAAHTAAQDSLLPGRAISHRDSLLVVHPSSTEYFFIHRLKPKQTLLLLSRYYAVGIKDILAANPSITDPNAISVGQELYIPITLRVLKLKTDATMKYKWKNVPVFYRVRPGETLYTVAKGYFGLNVDTLMQRNNLKSNVVAPNQLLQIGWLDAKGVDPAMRKYTGVSGQLGEINSKLKERFQREANDKVLVREKGIATWSKAQDATTPLLALHRSLPQGTTVRVTNPMNGKVLYLKVVAAFGETYPQDVIIFLSPSAAKALGGVNTRFVVQVESYK